MATVKRSSTNGKAPVADVAPEEAAAIRSSVAGKEIAPSSRQQAVFSDWRAAADQLGTPFETERIPISKLRQMRRDPMLGFGLSFIKTPHVRAKWYINAKGKEGPNAQIAAHLDHDLRRIYPSFVLQWTNALDFGFQAIAKRFEFRTPAGTYLNIDPNSGERTEEPIWSEGGIEPIAWKPFVALQPEYVEPLWGGDGSFNGIDYDPGAAANAPSEAEKRKKFKIDLYHSLWATNEKDANFGSIFGYPRLGYAYRYWWSYWFRWAIADRAFERKADPSVLVYHPEGEFTDPDTGETLDYGEYALLMGERMRSGGVIALPSEVYEDANGRGTIRQWELDFTKDAVNFEPFDKSFDYLDIQKLRALWIPEQAFLEGKGGTSSRNVAAEMSSSFTESQAVLASQIVETVNRYLIPQWLAVNYPEFVADGGVAEMIMQGFADEDVEFTKQIIQMVGQQEAGAREISKLVDLQRVLEDAGTPIAPFAVQQRREEELAAEAAAAAAPAVEPGPGTVGVVPTSTGFSYVQPQDVIYLSESGAAFIDNLPETTHYTDKTTRSLARQLWTMYRDLYRDEYESAFDALGNLSELTLAESDEKNYLSEWNGSRKWLATLSKTRDIFKKILARAAKVELKRAKLTASINDDEADQWVKDHLAEFAAQVAQTTRSEINNFVAKKLEEGIIERDEIISLARQHFNSFPDWKADRLVRTEVRDVYNQATLMAAAAAEKDVQAIDGDDESCAERDGKIFKVTDAVKEKEHPNGTLAWRILPVSLSIVRSDDIAGAEFDDGTLTLSDSLDPKIEASILKSVVDSLVEV